MWESKTKGNIKGRNAGVSLRAAPPQHLSFLYILFVWHALVQPSPGPPSARFFFLFSLPFRSFPAARSEEILAGGRFFHARPSLSARVKNRARARRAARGRRRAPAAHRDSRYGSSCTELARHISTKKEDRSVTLALLSQELRHLPPSPSSGASPPPAPAPSRCSAADRPTRTARAWAPHWANRGQRCRGRHRAWLHTRRPRRRRRRRACTAGSPPRRARTRCRGRAR